MNLFRKEDSNFVTDVAQYAGNYRGITDDLMCWEIKDPNINPFHDIIEAVYLSVSQCPSIPRSAFIFIDIFIRGKSLEEGVIYVMLGGSTARTRKIALKHVRRNCDLQPYPGLKLDHWDWPPHMPNTILTGKGTGHVHPNTQLVYRGPRYEVWQRLTNDVRQSGQRKNNSYLSILGRNDDDESLRAGVVTCSIRVGDQNFFLAPAHIFMPYPPQESDEYTEGEDSSSESEFEMLRVGSATPSELTYDSSSSEVSEFTVGSRAYESRLIAPYTSQNPTEYLGLENIKPANQDFKIFSLARDYALAHMPSCQTLHERLQPISLQETTPIVPGRYAVSFTTPSGGLMDGWLEGRPTLMRLPYSDQFTQFYPISTAGPVKEGDSGSLVFDKVTNKIYGFIVAASMEGRMAFIVSAREVLEDITKILGIESSKSVISSGATLSPPSEDLPPIASQEHPYMPRRNAPSSSIAKFRSFVYGNMDIGDNMDNQENIYISPNKLRQYWTMDSIQSVLDEQSVSVDVYKIKESYLRTFSTLVFIDQVNLLQYAFIKLGLDDEKFPREECPWQYSRELSDLWLQFYIQQWKFFPLNLNPKILLDTIIAPSRVLPWKSHLINDGHSSTVYKITVEESCNNSGQQCSVSVSSSPQSKAIYFIDVTRGSSMRSTANMNSHNNNFVEKTNNICKQDNSPLGRNVFALKTYKKDKASAYENERKMYERLQENRSQNLLTYFGSFRQGDTYNLILEYVDGGDLCAYWQNMPAPQTAEEIRTFWLSLTDILKGISHVHKVGLGEQNSDKDNTTLVLHEYLKPGNILIHSPNRRAWPFKFQPKMSKLTRDGVRNMPSNLQDEHSRIKLLDSPAYSPPEASSAMQSTQSQHHPAAEATDIWAMGCILSQAAVWMAFGPSAITTYHEIRQIEMKRISKFGQSTFEVCFHDGVQPLRAVEEMHERAVKVLRNHGDTTTKRVVGVVERYMLTNYRHQVSANSISARFGHILDFDTPNPTTSTSFPPLARRKASRPNYAAFCRAPPMPSSPPMASLHGTFSNPAEKWRPRNNDLSFPGLGTEITAPKSLNNDRFLTLAAVSSYREARKNGSMGGVGRTEELVKTLCASLNRRDYLFFVEDSMTMNMHFNQATSAFQALSYLAKQISTDGIELVLASDPLTVHRSSSTTTLLNKMKRRRPQHSDDFHQPSMMERNFTHFVEKVALPRLLRPNRAESASRNIRRWSSSISDHNPLSIFIFTDGQWGKGKPFAAGIEKPISILAKHIHQSGLNKTHAMLHFVRFGDDEDAKRYLSFLDDDLGRQINCDIVDTEPIDGNVFKMFIGALDRQIDGNAYSVAV